MKCIDYKAAKYFHDKRCNIPNFTGHYYAYYGTNEEAAKEEICYGSRLDYIDPIWLYEAPTYYEVWNFLWEKGLRINMQQLGSTVCPFILGSYYEQTASKRPEDAIVNAVNYIVKHDLLKDDK